MKKSVVSVLCISILTLSNNARSSAWSSTAIPVQNNKTQRGIDACHKLVLCSKEAGTWNDSLLQHLKAGQGVAAQSSDSRARARTAHCQAVISTSRWSRDKGKVNTAVHFLLHFRSRCRHVPSPWLPKTVATGKACGIPACAQIKSPPPHHHPPPSPAFSALSAAHETRVPFFGICLFHLGH